MYTAVFTILSNLRLRPSWDCSGVSGASMYAESWGEFLGHLRNSDLVVVNGLEITLKLCELFILAPWLRRPLVAVDVVLRRPDSVKGWFSTAVTRHLLRSVDYFIHYFRDLDDYERYFGITRERSEYVPFKPNLRYRVEAKLNADGNYVLCLGQSMRDYDTFFDAVEGLPIPAAIPSVDYRELRRHYSSFSRTLSELPANVRILADDKSQASLVRLISGAKLVVLPILKSSICASGIGIYLNSMLLGKCVLISRGPGASDVLTNQALLFEPEDASALASAIRRAWEDDHLREKTAAAGHTYALSLGGEPELCDRVLKATILWHGRASHEATRCPKQPYAAAMPGGDHERMPDDRQFSPTLPTSSPM
jgi:glycosyltransferase involved in cell wall biosynthesis